MLSFILLFVIVGFIQINRSYTRGITTKEVQSIARDVMEELSRAIRDAEASSIDTTSSNQRMCVGSLRYAWNMYNPGLTNDTFADDGSEFITLVRTDEPGLNCNGDVNETPGTGATTKLLPDNLMIQYLDIDRIGSTNSFSVTLVISTDGRTFPDDFSATGLNAACEIQTGSQFCDVALLETVVTTRN